MPLCLADVEIAKLLAREARRFADIVLQAPVDEEAPVHPELDVLVRAFEEINRVLAAANEDEIVSFEQMGTVATQFQLIGETLTGWGTRQE